MTREPCKYCDQEERYGHNAFCVMNTVDELRAEIEQLKAENARLFEGINARDAVIARLRADRNKLKSEIGQLKTGADEVYAWLREPDIVENADLEWMIEWINRRPLKAALEPKP